MKTRDNNLGALNKGVENRGNCNHGSWNEGDFNVGDCNHGDCNHGSQNKGNGNYGNNNVGDYNVGDGNIGHDNLGSHNIGICNVGEFVMGIACNKECPIYIFNKPSKMTLSELMESGAIGDIRNGNLTKAVKSIDTFDQEVWDELMRNERNE